jgi:hypothetical protein
MQLVAEAAVGPGDPDQREHYGELAESTPCQVPGQIVGALRDQHEYGQVVEEFKWADYRSGGCSPCGRGGCHR